MELTMLSIQTMQALLDKPGEYREVTVDIYPNVLLTGKDDGVRVGKKVYVSPEIFAALVDKNTFDQTISGLFIIDCGPSIDWEAELKFIPEENPKTDINESRNCVSLYRMWPLL